MSQREQLVAAGAYLMDSSSPHSPATAAAAAAADHFLRDGRKVLFHP